MVPGLGNVDPHSSQREELQSELLTAVKNCQTRFGRRTELATELDPHVIVLCNILEVVLSHGLKNRSSDKKASAIKQVTDLVLGINEIYSIWDVVSGLLSHHEKERYEMLRHVWTDRGRSRAWLRSSLNEHSLERYINSLLSGERVKTFYEEWAFVRNLDSSNILPNLAAGLSSVLFALNIDKPELNHLGSSNQQATAREEIIPDPVVIAGKPKPEGRKPKKALNIISFGDDSDLEMPVETLHNEMKTSLDTSICFDEQSFEEGDPEVECAQEATGVLCDQDMSNSDTDQNHDCDTSSIQFSSGLRPLNSSVGELILVQVADETHSSEDSISVPSVSEEGDIVGGASGTSEKGSTGGDAVTIESFQKEILRLQNKLDQANDLNTTLRSQLSQSAQQNQQKLQTSEMKIQELDRENELLKHQLRKYVSAVQMLKQEGKSFEGNELYEQKLVQVAEMHGELMELNDRLQRSLITKETVIRRLYLELEALRGPLGPTEVDISAQIINLWVPSVFLTGSPKQYHVYQVHTRIAEEEWNVYRRYTQFHSLHKDMKKQYPVISAFQFPPKKTIGNKDSKFVEERRLKLQQYLRRLMNHIVANCVQLSSVPSKSLLISIVPFFGEQNEPSNQRRPSPRPSFPRSVPSGSPQYAGL